MLETAPAAITRLRLANAGNSGTWIVWSVEGAASPSAAVVSPSLAMTQSFPIAANHGALVPTSFAVDSFRGSLAVAVVEQTGGANDAIQVVAIDETGARAWSTTVTTDGTVNGAVSLRAAPDGSALMLAWSELPPGATMHRLRVARLDCTRCAGAGAACASASDCCGGACEGGVCTVSVPTIDVACTSNADCVATGTQCSTTLGACVPTQACQSDADCMSGSFCDTAVSECLSAGRGDCGRDTDCPLGQHCDVPAEGCIPAPCVSAGGACLAAHDCCSNVCGSGTCGG